VIATAGKAVARLAPFEPARAGYSSGALKGKLHVAETTRGPDSGKPAYWNSASWKSPEFCSWAVGGFRAGIDLGDRGDHCRRAAEAAGEGEVAVEYVDVAATA
jgi:hypothetical protein